MNRLNKWIFGVFDAPSLPRRVQERVDMDRAIEALTAQESPFKGPPAAPAAGPPADTAGTWRGPRGSRPASESMRLGPKAAWERLGGSVPWRGGAVSAQGGQRYCREMGARQGFRRMQLFRIAWRTERQTKSTTKLEQAAAHRSDWNNSNSGIPQITWTTWLCEC